jgi:hypothetical protein
MKTATHAITRGTTNGPGYSTQYYARCVCGWVQVAVTDDSLSLYVNGHRAHVARTEGSGA